VEVRVAVERFIEFRGPNDERIRFRINVHNNGTLTFSDPRDRMTGVAGTTGSGVRCRRLGFLGRGH
jgi:hypothetical protein